MSKPPWIVGQSGNPNGRGRPLRLRREGMVRDLAKAVGRERVAFTDSSPGSGEAAQQRGDDKAPEPATESAVYTRFERIIRVLFTMAQEGNLAAIRCLFEYADGKPARQPPNDGKRAGNGLTADDLSAQLPFRQLSLLEIEGDKCESETEPLRKPGRNG